MLKVHVPFGFTWRQPQSAESPHGDTCSQAGKPEEFIGGSGTLYKRGPREARSFNVGSLQQMEGGTTSDAP